MSCRILLADDHLLFRQALRMTLEMHPEITIVAEAQDGQGVVAAAALSRPEVVCLDLNMPGPSTSETVQQLLAADPALKIIAMSADTELFKVAGVINAGARAYVTKIDIANQLPAAILSVARNKIYFSPDLCINDVSDLVRHMLPDSP
ncbi:response regulator transcription factor [Dechloromonas denitrificans]|uniref:response regulator n=1 Tax=Dechloromonas denitrificans TaxID=281362 RepID=UPI001CF823FD|nr:response regulator transcription factor [Dechloromonas denitrificans]UCV01727.1 response regulator transcription factor [Dechloromonas denitrificans]UCV06095.1 response regulator transcription factor [Dechloromonas denitrificans]